MELNGNPGSVGFVFPEPRGLEIVPVCYTSAEVRPLLAWGGGPSGPDVNMSGGINQEDNPQVPRLSGPFLRHQNVEALIPNTSNGCGLT